MCCSVLQCVAMCCSVLQCVAVCCSVLQCVAMRCSVLQCVAARSRSRSSLAHTKFVQVVNVRRGRAMIRALSRRDVKIYLNTEFLEIGNMAINLPVQHRDVSLGLDSAPTKEERTMIYTQIT